MTNHLRLECEGALARLTFVRAQGLNILSSSMLDELERAWQQLEARPEIRICILKGEGKVFLAGADIKAMVHMDPATAERFSAHGQRVFEIIERSRIVSIAALHGAALGGGCELALACDLRLCAAGTKLGQPEVNLGLIPGFGGTQRLTRLIGCGHASYLILTGEPIDAAAAEKIGLVNKVVPLESLADESEMIAQLLLQKGPQALVQAKTCIRAVNESTYALGMDVERTQFALNFGNGEGREGMQAFIEKRKPVF